MRFQFSLKFLKIPNVLLLFIVSETKYHIVGAEEDIVSVPYFTVFEFLQ